LFFYAQEATVVTWTILNVVFTHFCGPASFNNIEVNGGALRFNQKYLNLCSEDERKSYRVGVITDRIFILG